MSMPLWGLRASPLKYAADRMNSNVSLRGLQHPEIREPVFGERPEVQRREVCAFALESRKIIGGQINLFGLYL